MKAAGGYRRCLEVPNLLGNRPIKTGNSTESQRRQIRCHGAMLQKRTIMHGRAVTHGTSIMTPIQFVTRLTVKSPIAQNSVGSPFSENQRRIFKTSSNHTASCRDRRAAPSECST
ncbi:MAG TPA: hypothetical protein DEF45_14295 [Rhodopirellula sp.]|nr:MAG: hypothetical protein CBD74_09195 [Saprospirales bacterium TMED214]HBV64181.1 hypothetical protein [Rhodopirellula sp.]